jgi:hypothetical protein
MRRTPVPTKDHAENQDRRRLVRREGTKVTGRRRFCPQSSAGVDQQAQEQHRGSGGHIIGVSRQGETSAIFGAMSLV